MIARNKEGVMKSISLVTLALIFVLSFFNSSNTVLTPLEVGSEIELTERLNDSAEEDANPDFTPKSSLFEKLLYAQSRNYTENSCNDRSIPHCPYHSQAPPTLYIL